jgi:hypothetical protein
MDSEHPPDLHFDLNVMGIEVLIKLYEAEVDHYETVVEGYRELLEIGSTTPKPWTLETTRLSSENALRVAAATHRISEVAIMMCRLKELKYKQFASYEESAKWDEPLMLLFHHLRQKHAMLVQEHRLCRRYEVVSTDHSSNLRENNEIEQEANEALKREVVNSRLKYWQHEAHTRSIELWLEVQSQGKHAVSDLFATVGPI